MNRRNYSKKAELLSLQAEDGGGWENFITFLFHHLFSTILSFIFPSLRMNTKMKGEISFYDSIFLP